jgi:hypothetical protein
VELRNADELMEAIDASGLTYDEIARTIETTRWRKRRTHRKGDDPDRVSQSLIAKMATGAREIPRRGRYDPLTQLKADSIHDDLVALFKDESWVQEIKSRRGPGARGPYRKRSR